MTRAQTAIHGSERLAATAIWTPAPRTYRVTYKRDHRPGWGLHWRLHTSGDGHWCVGGPEAGAFSSETAAHEAGRRWVETGRIA